MPSQPSAEERAESLYRLAAGTVHDVNNLLALVVGCAELALDDDLTPRTRQLLQEIASVGERATSLTRQFLTLGKPPVAPTSIVDVTEVLRAAGTLLKRVLGHRVPLHLDLDAEPQWVLAEASQLEQILVNLAVNARDAMPGGGSLTVASRAVECPGSAAQGPFAGQVPVRMTRVTVTDTGHGIDPTIRERMYEPFVTTKGGGKGAGLGLSVVQAIVSQLGGTISVTTAAGQGTTFAIDLPLAAAPDSVKS
jgi:two-component system, cell cycle sensor histidine kinase and response regulator CckA